VFVGRGSELNELANAAAVAQTGEPRVVLIEGEAGIGKSTLLNHFLSTLSDAVVVRASGDKEERVLGYGVISQLLESTRGAKRADATDLFIGWRVAELLRDAGLIHVRIEGPTDVCPLRPFGCTNNPNFVQDIRNKITARGALDRSVLGQRGPREHLADPGMLAPRRLHFLAWGRKPAEAKRARAWWQGCAFSDRRAIRSRPATSRPTNTRG
jgi:AAA ATPase domain